MLTCTNEPTPYGCNVFSDRGAGNEIELSRPTLAFSVAAHAQNPPTQPLRQWAHNHVHPIASVHESSGDADMQPLRNIIGDAHVVAFGEPIHGAHEPLAMRNRLIRYGVTRLGFTAVALETCLSSSKRLYDYWSSPRRLSTRTQAGTTRRRCGSSRWLTTYCGSSSENAGAERFCSSRTISMCRQMLGS